jgi:hypothetical protein
MEPWIARDDEIGKFKRIWSLKDLKTLVCTLSPSWKDSALQYINPTSLSLVFSPSSISQIKWEVKNHF